MVCSGFTGITTIGDMLVWPTGCNYYIYLIVFTVVFITLTLILYNREREEKITADIISSMGVSAIVTLVLALSGTLIKNSAGIPMVQQDIFMYVFAMSIIFILIWFFKK